MPAITDTQVQEIIDKVEALGEGFTDKQRAFLSQMIEERTDQRVQAALEAMPKPAPVAGNPDADVLVGTKYERCEMGPGDVQLLHAIAESARVKGFGNGPTTQLRNIVAELDKRDVAARGPEAAGWPDEPKSRAMDTAESGYGSQLIGAQYVTTLWDAAHTESRIMSLIDTFPMSAPTTYLPVRGAPAEPILAAESTANNSSNYDTQKTGSNRVTVTAKKLLIHQMWSTELEEDSIIPFVPFLQREAAFSVAHFGDALVLNGDNTNAATGNINLDDADPADTKYYLAFDGIRHAALVDATGQGYDMNGAVSWAALTKTAKQKLIDTTYFIDWGNPISRADLIYACEPETALAVSQLDEVIKARETNPGRATLPGEVASILDHPFISTMAMPKTEADGKMSTTANNNTKGQIAVFNRGAYVIGIRRRVQVKVEELPGTDQMRVVYSWRLGLGRYTNTGAASGIKHTAVIYNITV